MTNGNRITCWLAMAALATSWSACAAPDAVAAVSATLAADGRSFRMTAPGLSEFRAGFSASVRSGGQKRELSSAEGVAVGPAQRLTAATPYGRAELSAMTFHFETEQVDVLYRFGRVPGVPGVLAQVGIRNVGRAPVDLLSTMPVALAGQLTGKPADWLVSNLHPTNDYATKRVVDIGSRLHVWECGGLYRQDAAGFLFGPVGTPIAYVNTRIKHGGDGKVTLDITAQMDGVRVDPGETRWGQQVLLLVEPPQAALARWAEWVGKTHGARTSNGALSGWSSWYFLAGAVTGKEVLEVAEATSKSQYRLRPEVIQIDAGYEDPSGAQETNEKFAEGLEFYAQRIAATGARPGLQVGLPAPPVGPTLVDRGGWDDLARRIHRAVGRGFTYLKIDFYGVRMGGVADPKKTTFEMKREGFAKLREAAGETIYLLYCDFQPDRSTVGQVDASRTGVAASRPVVRAAMPDVLRSYQLHDRWFAVDNCNYYMGTDVANLSEIDGGWPLVRTWMSMVGLSCGAAITSDPWHWDSFKPFWRNVEAMTPPAKERTEVLDLGMSEEWPRLVGHVHRDWGDSAVALLWNPGTTERTVTLDFAQAGMDPKGRYAVWSFWDNRYLGVAQGAWTTPALAPSGSQHLCFTDLDRAPNEPVLVGSNLHIYCGAAETKRITSSRSRWQIELTDAGARDGDLFVYSRLPLVLKAATGCVVTGITQAGEYMWRISLAERQHASPQRVDLEVLLPVTQQIWFWLLIALVVASLAFAASRYVTDLGLQREHTLDQERARIARDMHDEVGSQLARLSMLGQLLIDAPTVNPADRLRAQAMTRGVRQAAGDLENIIWAVNPKNDTLDQLAYRICQYVEEFFADTPVHCRFAEMPVVPALAMAAEARAAVFSAVKEALANVLQHAAATALVVALGVEDRDFQVRLADNGRGFDPARFGSVPGLGGNGLTNMRVRLARIGGECRIESVPGQGTTVILRWPLDKPRSRG